MTAKESVLLVVGYGNAGFDEMRTYVDDSAVQFGLARFELGSGSLRRYKFLFLHVNGHACAAVTRGKANAYLSDAMEIMRGGEENSGFSASVEITEKSQASAEYILSRVGKLFVSDDAGEYSVKWLMDSYQQFIDASKHKKGSSSASNEGADRTVKCLGHKSAPLFSSGRDALKAVGEPLGAWNWVFIGSDPAALPLVDGGSGSVDEMRESMVANDKDVLFGLLRLGFGIGRLRRTKHVFVQAIGTGVSAFNKGKVGALKPKMEKALAQFALCSCAIEITDPADLTVEGVIERVRQAAIIDDEELEGDKAGKNIFSVEHFREALREEMKAHDNDGEKEPPKAKGGFGDKTVEEVVRLIHLPESDLNWALFAVNDKHRKSVVQQKKNSLFVPDGKHVPQGGYMAARTRTSTAAVSDRVSVTSSSALSPRSRANTAVVIPRASMAHRESMASKASGYPSHWGKSAVALDESDDEGDSNRFRDMLRPVGTKSGPAGKPRLAGALLKQAPGVLFGTRWQLRHFQIADGRLQWWQTVEEKRDGHPPRNELDLTGLKVKMMGAKIELHSTDSMARKGRPYVLDTAVHAYVVNGDAAHDSKTWVQAMEQEAVLARSKRMSLPAAIASPVSHRGGHRRFFSISH